MQLVTRIRENKKIQEEKQKEQLDQMKKYQEGFIYDDLRMLPVAVFRHPPFFLHVLKTGENNFEGIGQRGLLSDGFGVELKPFKRICIYLFNNLLLKIIQRKD